MKYFEREIVKQVIKDALKFGWELEVDSGEEIEYRGKDADKAFEALDQFDDAYLFLYSQGERPKGWVRFVFGNYGWDVVNDYTVNLEDTVMKKANEMADEFSD